MSREPHAPHGGQPPARILVVDDDPGARFGLSGALRDAGFEVDTAEDGLGALERCRRREPDLVVTDLDMPIMRGEKLIAALRQRHPAVDIAVMTGEVNVDAGRHAVALGVATWFSKPLQLDDVIDRITARLAALRSGAAAARHAEDSASGRGSAPGGSEPHHGVPPS